MVTPLRILLLTIPFLCNGSNTYASVLADNFQPQVVDQFRPLPDKNIPKPDGGIIFPPKLELSFPKIEFPINFTITHTIDATNTVIGVAAIIAFAICFHGFCILQHAHIMKQK